MFMYGNVVVRQAVVGSIVVARAGCEAKKESHLWSSPSFMMIPIVDLHEFLSSMCLGSS